jgi:membrane-associated phospholipid phosphatase
MSLLLFAFWIGATRIRARKHHPDDVVGGFFIGAICTIIIFAGSYKRIFRRLKEELSEELSN